MKNLAWAFGIVLTVVGILGFVPGLTNDGLLLGIFQVDPLHNVIHLLSGVVALVAVMMGAYVRQYFQVFGVVYALVAILGFVQGDTVLNLIAINMADNVLHVAIAAVSLWAGFMMKPAVAEPAPVATM